MTTWNTRLESYQPRVYNNTLATVKHQIQQAENPTHAVVICMEAPHVHNAILLDHLASEVALEEPEIGSTDPNILIDNNCTDVVLHFGMAEVSRDYQDERDGSNVRDGSPTAIQQRLPATDLKRLDMGTSDVDGYVGEDCNDADADEEEEASQANVGSTQNVEDSGHSRFDLGTSDLDRYECKHVDDEEADEEEETLQADYGSTRNVED